ncbi:cellulase family glycosylhydrolase [Flavobacterium sp. SE-1-e]|uniref:Cellulase family glycosylhydrolase n=2 Tax=Flavobacterium agrisoli TaxID=2793066 RepID=A0A934PKR9_9FLAO|nr:cellulase family glycosylhydrolase [Flavobacterium agrisoli]
MVVLVSCSNNSPDEVEEVKKITLSSKSFEITSKAKIEEVTLETNVSFWTISNSASDWILVNKITGGAGTTKLIISVSKNTSTETRKATLTVSSSEITSQKIEITQTGITVTTPQELYPSYNTNPLPADATGMSSSAVELASKMKLGWNIGNTLEAIGGETAWGNPKVTKALIDAVKANGFNAIRIPCSWNQNANTTTAKINDVWLNRVKEVVQYCTDNDMYVIVNIHWDGGWLEENCTEAKKEANNAKQKAFWEQIATHLRGFDEHVLFASANEPHVDDATEMAVLTSYHQTFINAVRSTGGKNAYRTLIVQGPATDIGKTNNLMNVLPTDTTTNRMMVEIHYYAPWQFAGLTKDESWGKMFYYWGADNHSITDASRNPAWGEESQVDSDFKLMKTKFVDKGIPVIMGEFGAIRRTDLTGDALALHLKSRAYYLQYVVKQAKLNSLIPFYWDEGSIKNNGFGIFDRSSNTVFDTQILNALKEGIK